MDNQIVLLAALLVAAGIAVAVIRLRSQLASDGGEGWGDAEETSQETTIFEDALIAVSPSTYYAPQVDAAAMEKNLSAFLDLIAFSEGTGNNYNVMFGWPRIDGRTFASYADHPRQYFSFTDKTGKALKTSAAGRYQFLARTWDDLRAKLGLTDFGPASQDAAAIELIRQRGALNDVKAGRIVDAIAKCAPIWASLPGAGYNQPERKLSSLINAFNNSGGTLSA